MANFGPYTDKSTVQGMAWLLLGRRVPGFLHLSPEDVLRLFVRNAYEQIWSRTGGYPVNLYPAYTQDKKTVDFSTTAALTDSDKANYAGIHRIHGATWDDGNGPLPLVLASRQWLENRFHGDTSGDLESCAIDGLTLIVAPPFKATAAAGSSTSNLRVGVDVNPMPPTLDVAGDGEAPILSGYDYLFAQFAVFLILENKGVRMPDSLKKALTGLNSHIATLRAQVHELLDTASSSFPRDYR